MKRYNLKSILLEETEEVSDTPADAAATPPADPPSAPAEPEFNINDFVTFTQDNRLLDLAGYNPNFVAKEITLPGTDVKATEITFQGPTDAQKLQVQNKAKTTYGAMKATDFSEFMGALYFARTNNAQTAVGGPSQHYDVDDGKGGAWEVKSLGTVGKPGSALTGVGGREILGTGLTELRVIVRSLQDAEKFLARAQADEDTWGEFDFQGVQETCYHLHNAIKNVLAEIKGKDLTGELAPKMWAASDSARRTKFTETQWSELMKSMFDIIGYMRQGSLRCRPGDLTISFGARSIDLSKLKQKQISRVIAAIGGLLEGGEEVAYDTLEKVFICRLRDKIPEIFHNASKQNFIKRMIRIIPSVATNMKGDEAEALRRKTYSKLVDAYASKVSGFAGFIFAFDVGSGTDIASGEVTIFILPIKEARKLEAGLKLGANISMGVPKISFMGHLMDVDEQRNTRQTDKEVGESTEEEETSTQAPPKVESVSRSIDNVLTERQKRFWSWATEE